MLDNIYKVEMASDIATGSTNSRTRLYRIGITNNFETINRDFTVSGLRANAWEFFQKDVDYYAFLVKKKRVHYILSFWCHNLVFFYQTSISHDQRRVFSPSNRKV